MVDWACHCSWWTGLVSAHGGLGSLCSWWTGLVKKFHIKLNTWVSCLNVGDVGIKCVPIKTFGRVKLPEKILKGIDSFIFFFTSVIKLSSGKITL